MIKRCACCGYNIRNIDELRKNKFIGAITGGEYNVYLFNCRICESTLAMSSEDLTKCQVELDLILKKISDSIIV